MPGDWKSPLSRDLPCPRCAHPHLWLDCDRDDCPCTAHERTGIDTRLYD